MKLRFFLPVVNVAVCVWALIADNPRSGQYGINPEPPPLLLACYLINAPVLLIRYAVVFLLGKIIPAVCGMASLDACYLGENLAARGVFLLGAGLLWYLVGHAIEGEWKGGVPAVPFRSWRRVTMDVAAVLFAFLCVSLGVLNWKDRAYPLRLPLPFLSLVLWGLVLAVLFGRDLLKPVACRPRAETTEAEDR